jgi:hypothetical protein
MVFWSVFNLTGKVEEVTCYIKYDRFALRELAADKAEEFSLTVVTP